PSSRRAYGRRVPWFARRKRPCASPTPASGAPATSGASWRSTRRVLGSSATEETSMSDWQKRYQRLLFDRPHPKVLRVTMNRPDKYNATDSIMHTELVNVWHDIDGDDTINCVIIQGAGGKVFSAGGDFDLIEKNMKDHN